jgi:hypothetical protein
MTSLKTQPSTATLAGSGTGRLLRPWPTLVVLDTALYAQTDAKGLASLRDLPADAMIHAWCPRMRGDPIAHRLQPGQSYVELVLKLRPAFSRTPPDDREGGYR